MGVQRFLGVVASGSVSGVIHLAVRIDVFDPQPKAPAFALMMFNARNASAFGYGSNKALFPSARRIVANADSVPGSADSVWERVAIDHPNRS